MGSNWGPNSPMSHPDFWGGKAQGLGRKPKAERGELTLVSVSLAGYFHRSETQSCESIKLSTRELNNGISTAASLHSVHLKPSQTLYLRQDVLAHLPTGRSLLAPMSLRFQRDPI